MQPKKGRKRIWVHMSEMRNCRGDEAGVSLGEKVLFWQNNWWVRWMAEG